MSVRAPSSLTRTELPVAWWARGLNLRERLSAGGPTSAAPDPDGRAERRLARWESAHGLGDSGQFQRRLAAAGIGYSQLTALLIEEPDALARRIPEPTWARIVEQILDELAEHQEFEPIGQTWVNGLHAIVSPFQQYAALRLRGLLAGHDVAGSVDLKVVLPQLAAQVANSLVALAARTLVLELNVLRVTDRLEGSTGPERFENFVRQFRRAEQLTAFVAEYPVLARLLAESAHRAADVQAELLLRFRADRSVLVRRLHGGVDPGPLTEVATGGDTHHGGRAVAVLRFANGTRIVYKPRSLAVHGHYNDVLRWFNARLPGLDLRRLTVVERTGYGWLEFAEHQPCADSAAIERYYHRQGAVLALLYAFGGADFHFENLIACADQPVLIDLEALLHPTIPAGGPDWLVDDPAGEALASSVTRAAMLPLLLVGDNGAVDLSGLGGDKGVQMPIKSVIWAGAGTDEMCLTRDHVTFGGAQNRPRIGELDGDPTQHIEHLIAGFRAGYRTIAANHADLTASGGLLARFADDEIRVVSRATQVYAKLMDESTHPDLMRDGLDRDRILDYLWAASVDDSSREGHADDEIAEMWAGDVPLFNARPGARALTNGIGVRFVDALAESSLEAAARKIDQMGPADLARQEWIIHAAMAGRSVPGQQQPGPAQPTAGADTDSSAMVFAAQDAMHAASAASGWVAPQIAGTAGVRAPLDQERLVAAAQRIGDELATLACEGRGRVNWLGLSLVDDRHWMLQPLSFGLQEGFGGVALFLAQLAAVSGLDRYAGLCRRALAPVPAIADSLSGYLRASGPAAGAGLTGLDGASGLAYLLTSVADLLGDRSIAEPVDGLLELAGRAISADVTEASTSDANTPDGALADVADCLAASLAIASATGSDIAGRTAALAAGRLLRDDIGVAVVDPGQADPSAGGDRPATAFGPGAAGIGWALLRHAAHTGDERSRTLGLAVLAADRELAIPAPPAGRSWYDGTTGRGLVMLDALRGTDDVRVRAHATRLVTAEAVADPSPRQSLQHGELGRLELLALALQHEKCLGTSGPGHGGGSPADLRVELPGALNRRVRHLLETLETSGPRCATPGAARTPTLATGLAGIGHGLLRLAHPLVVRSTLLLADPTGSPR